MLQFAVWLAGSGIFNRNKNYGNPIQKCIILDGSCGFYCLQEDKFNQFSNGWNSGLNFYQRYEFQFGFIEFCHELKQSKSRQPNQLKNHTIFSFWVKSITKFIRIIQAWNAINGAMKFQIKFYKHQSMSTIFIQQIIINMYIF